MKPRYQRFIHCLLCAALLAFLFAVPVNAAETSGACGEDATWTLVDGVLTISGTGKTWDFRDDASRFDYHPCPWEGIKDEIREVIVEEGITYLGASAFMECANLERVSLPESLTVLESFAISYCRQLSECELPSHLEHLDDAEIQRDGPELRGYHRRTRNSLSVPRPGPGRHFLRPLQAQQRSPRPGSEVA